MVILREALRSDIEGIYEIERACFSTPWSKEALLDDLEVEDKLYLVAEAEAEAGKIIGYAGSWLVLDEGQITNIAIHPEYRRAGYGAKMTRKLTQMLHKRGMKHIFLEVRVSNIAAQAMYRRLGFTAVGVRKQFYSDPIEDGLIMTKEMEELT